MKRGELMRPKPMSRGALYLMLANRIYVGEIAHRDKHFTGEHAAIVDPAIFAAAPTMLATNKNGHQSGANFDQQSLLAGLLWDQHGRRMSPTHSKKGPSRRYRYYVSRNDRPARDQPIMRVPAADIEAVVVGRLCALLRDEGALMDAVATQKLDAVALNAMLFECLHYAERLITAAPTEVREIVTRHISHIAIHGDQVMVHVEPATLTGIARPATRRAAYANDNIVLTVSARLGRTGREVRLVIDPSTLAPACPAKNSRDPALIKLVVKAHAAREAMMASSDETIEEIANAQGYDRDYFGALLKISWLAPDITQSVLEGRQKHGMNRQAVARMAGPPLRWDEQSSVKTLL